MVALYRPGPMDLIEEFVNRKHGRSPIAYEHPLMERHLQETYGIMVYQEQVMRLAADLAGLTLGEADILRKAMGKKDRELMAQQREKFIGGCKANKIDAAQGRADLGADRQVRRLRLQQESCRVLRARGVSDGVLESELPGRVHGRAAHVGNGQDGQDRPVRRGVPDHGAPRVSLPTSTCRARSSPSSADSIHFGLAAIKNVGGAAIESIVKSRSEAGGFISLEDFCSRADLRLVNRRVLESLIKAGAFDSLKSTRAGLLSGLDQAMEVGQRRQRDRDEGQTSLFDALGRRARGGRARADDRGRRAGVAARGDACVREGSARLLSLRPSARAIPRRRPSPPGADGGRARRPTRRCPRPAARLDQRGDARTPRRAATAWPSRRSSWSTAAFRSPCSRNRIEARRRPAASGAGPRSRAHRR